MEVPITQFRREIFSLANNALEGQEVWFTHKGRRLKIVPEGKPVDKLSRITPMDIIADGVNLNDNSWKEKTMREWERNWDRQLAALSDSPPDTAAPKRGNARRTRSNV